MKIMMTLWVCQLTLNKKGFLDKALTKHNLTMTLKNKKKKQMALYRLTFIKDINTVFIRTMNKQQ